MKKLLIISLLLSRISFSHAQGYTFSVSQAPYSDLILSTSLSNGATWDDPDYTVPIGFTFYVYNDPLTEMTTGAGLGALFVGPDYVSSPTSILVANGADIIDRGYNFNLGSTPTGGLSNISYLTEGVPGNRVFKMEWKNVGFYSELDDDGISTDFTNFQLWLYEATGNIEIRFGPNSVTQPILCYDGETGPFFGLYADYDLNSLANLSSALELIGPANNPTAQASIDPYLTFTDGTVSNGRVYRYTRTLASLKDDLYDESKFSVSPNPTEGKIVVALSNKAQNQGQLIITNQLGQILETIDMGNEQKTDYEFDLSSYEAGVYFVSINTEGQSMTKKIFKK
jgi:Secretion system C-terminal sorting domain